jgi:hypothetical protein
MPVIGMRIDSIQGRRGKPTNAPHLSINSMPKVTKVREIDLQDLGKKALALTFEFSTTYQPGDSPQPAAKEAKADALVGSIMMAGDLIYLPENAQDVMKHWESKKSLPEGMRVEVLNHLFSTCLLRMANIAQELQLPLPLNLPRVEPQKASGAKNEER